MSSDWAQVRLAEVTSILGDGLHGTPEYDDNGDFYFINGNNLSSGRIVVNDKTRRVSESEALNHQKVLNDRTILVSINGTLGNIAFYNGEKVVLGKSACYFNVLNEVDKHFVRYVLENKAFQSYIANLATGSTIKNVSLRLMRDFSFLLPPLFEQQRIASVLSAFDDRIALLHETNATLESITQELFKSWFVDFDPVRAKMEGRGPEGMDEATAALFPDSFEESELGLVPRGWQSIPLKSVAKLKGGKMLEREHYSELGMYPVFGGAGVMGRSDFSNADGFVITVGRVGAYCGQFFWHDGKAWVNNNASQVVPANENSTLWLYQWLRNVDMNLIKKGAAQPFVSNGDIESLKTIYPSLELVQTFNEISLPMFDQMSNNLRMISTLTTLKDTLLPRLISGQLRLPEAELEITAAI